MPIVARRSPVRPPLSTKKAEKKNSVFNVKRFLDSAGLGRHVCTFKTHERVFTQGDPSNTVRYIQDGGVKLTVVNKTGKEAVVAILGPGDFFGEGCLGGETVCIATATAVTTTTILTIQKSEMTRVLHGEQDFSDRFIAYMLARYARVQQDLIDQLFNSSEKRLARALLLLAHYGAPVNPQRLLPKMSQETLADMIGTTRSRVNFFMNKFRRLGFIEYNGEIHVNNSLLSVVLHE